MITSILIFLGGFIVGVLVARNNIKKVNKIVAEAKETAAELAEKIEKLPAKYKKLLISSDFVFVRLRNGEFNYSENPSFISGSTGEVIYNYFINSPQTFPTAVGMYNDANELIAGAKLSRPISKDFTKEALIRVKLDF